MGGSRARPHLSSQHSYSNAHAHACATSRKCPRDVLIPFFCNRQLIRTRSRATRASIHVEVFCFSLFLSCLCNITVADTYNKHDQSFKYRGQTYAEVIPVRVREIKFFSTLVFIWCHRVRGYPRPPAVQIFRLRAEMMKIWEAASQLRIRQIRITLNTETCKAAPAE